ncbi:MAG: chaperone modulator CbpM [Bdellovibrionota bacterium]
MITHVCFKLSEVASRCGLNKEMILEFVSQTWITPVDPDAMLFDDEDVARIRLIHDLRTQLGVNEDAIPVILHLVDQLHTIHTKIVPA